MAPSRRVPPRLVLTPLSLLRLGTLVQAAVLVPLGLLWLWVPVHELIDYRSGTKRDPTSDLGPYVVPILLAITALCLLAAGACLVSGVLLPLCARRLERRWAFRALVAIESVVWLVPLVRSDVPRTPRPGVLAVVLFVVGAIVVGLALLRPARPAPIPSPGVAPQLPDPNRPPRPPSTRRH